MRNGHCQQLAADTHATATASNPMDTGLIWMICIHCSDRGWPEILTSMNLCVRSEVHDVHGRQCAGQLSNQHQCWSGPGPEAEQLLLSLCSCLLAYAAECSLKISIRASAVGRTETDQFVASAADESESTDFGPLPTSPPPPPRQHMLKVLRNLICYPESRISFEQPLKFPLDHATFNVSISVLVMPPNASFNYQISLAHIGIAC